jgi:flagellar biosynthetic protein FlhB
MRESLLGRMKVFIQHCLGAAGDDFASADSAVTLLIWAARAMADMVFPLMLTVFILALVTSFGQVGVMFTFTPITPSLSKLSPLKGLKRMFSAHSAVHLAMGLAKTGVLSMVTYSTLNGRLDALAQAALMSHWAIAEVAVDLIFTLCLRLALALLILAIIDLIYQRWKYERDLRMTKQEIKEELRRMDGDPQIKRRRRDIQVQMTLQRLKSAVPKADVVVTNPTSFAVALKYDPQTMNAPRVVAKGADHMARRIREIAIANGVPIVERPPLARALFRTVEVGNEVPAQFYRAVAEILAYVYELAGRGYRRPPAAEYAMN